MPIPRDHHHIRVKAHAGLPSWKVLSQRRGPSLPQGADVLGLSNAASRNGCRNRSSHWSFIGLCLVPSASAADNDNTDCWRSSPSAFRGLTDPCRVCYYRCIPLFQRQWISSFRSCRYPCRAHSVRSCHFAPASYHRTVHSADNR